MVPMPISVTHSHRFSYDVVESTGIHATAPSARCSEDPVTTPQNRSIINHAFMTIPTAIQTTSMKKAMETTLLLRFVTQPATTT